MKGQVPGVISFSGWQDMEARAGLRKEQGHVEAETPILWPPDVKN